MAFKNYIQHYIMDCGPTCLKMVAKHYGKLIPLDTIREKIKVSKHGVSLFGIKEVAVELGFETTGASLSVEQLETITLPAIAHWRQNHFVVIYKVRKNKIWVSDPARGNKVYNKDEFTKLWSSSQKDGINFGVVLILDPTEKFFRLENEKDSNGMLGISHLFKFLYQHKKDLYFVLGAIGVSSTLQFIFPFLTQLIVDKGISNKDVSIVKLILLAQCALLLGRLFIEYMRSWLLLYISSRINVTILSDFLIKLLKLPISFFDTKMSGDILQRISDQRRIQDFLTGPALDLLFSLVTIIVLSITLYFYNLHIFLVFVISSLLYITWSIYMLKARRSLDYKRFEFSGQNQNEILQLVNGIQEIKLNNSEDRKRLSWELIQSKLFKLNIDSLRITQTLQSGSFLINEGKNILITYIAAVSVINGTFTLGIMLAIQAIVGQLNGPISILISLFQNFYDTKLSIERINEIHKLNDEKLPQKEYLTNFTTSKDILIKNLKFAYPGTYNNVLEIDELIVSYGKTTAIVGSSGSGKTTLLKLLLKFYENYDGEILLGDENLKSIDHSFWRNECGTVLQDGFIFSDTIAKNITISSDIIDYDRMRNAAQIANIDSFIDSLPLGFETKIGGDGMGLSQGQKQRILIARAAYKNPSFIFLDEATNALDTNNESIITKNLDQFFFNKTVVVVAHRLSTVRNADYIVVLDNGQVVEIGNHESLLKHHGFYHNLIFNQLELENS